MATYGLKYYAEFRNYRGQDYRLEVHQRGYSSTTKKIGDLSGCVLEVQGNMGSIIAPIVKTQLRFTVVDAPDMPAVSGTKFGDWQEFFTPDATLYKVILKCYISGAWATEWSGYITPDSWQESLDYRGGITITARDCLGHLKDFPFSTDGFTAVDANGLVMLKWLWKRAADIVEFPMTFAVEEWDMGHGGAYAAEVPTDDDENTLVEAMVNVALFEGMDWYEVLEQSLEAAGYVLRFVGGNKCQVMCLRNLPSLGNYTAATGTQALEFYGGTLELDPAVKRIEEEQDYKLQKEIQLPVFDGLEFASSYSTYRCKTDGNPLPGGGVVSIPEHDAQYKPNTSRGRTGWDIGSGMLDPDTETPDSFLVREEGEDGWRKYAFIACNQQPGAGGTSIVADYRFRSRTSGMKLTFRFTPNALTKEYQGSDAGKMQKNKYTLANIKLYAMFTDGTIERYWNGAGWVNSAYLLELDYDSANKEETDLVLEMTECRDFANGGEMVVRLGQITYKMSYDGGHGCYARVANILVEINAQTALKGNKVTTINNDAYNVLLTRRPLFGALSQEMGFIKPGNYLAGLYYYPFYGSDPYLYPYQVRFTDQMSSQLVPLPVLIHEQILCYYYGAARVLQGAAAPTNKALFRFNKLCTYKGKTYIFQGGTLDYFSGVIGNATFREFATWTSLWADNPPSYDEQHEYNR